MWIDLTGLGEWTVDGTVKGFPPTSRPIKLTEIGTRGWSVLRGDLPFPVAVLKRGAIETNRKWMRAFVHDRNVLLAPHGKTTMCPQLFALQAEDGAWGLTAATANQIAVYRRFGVNRILMANQLVGEKNIEFLASELVADPEFEFLSIVDSADGIQALATVAERFALHRGFEVLIEIGAMGARTGVRSVAEGVDLASFALSLHPWVRVRGVESYEGVFPSATPEEREQLVADLFSSMMMLADQLEKQGLFEPGPIFVSAGGTDFFDLAARKMKAHGGHDRIAIIRSGCYLTHDDLAYQRAFEKTLARSPDLQTLSAPFQPALEVWTCVQSRPEPGLVLLTAGKRDVSFDFEMPIAKWWARPGSAPQRLDTSYVVRRLNDQHAYVSVPEDSPVTVGDYVGLGVSHVCTTFDKWRLIYLVDDDYGVTGAVQTFF